MQITLNNGERVTVDYINWYGDACRDPAYFRRNTFTIDEPEWTTAVLKDNGWQIIGRDSGAVMMSGLTAHECREHRTRIDIDLMWEAQ